MYNGPIYYGNRSFFREDVSLMPGLTWERISSREKASETLEKREREAVNSVVRRPTVSGLDHILYIRKDSCNSFNIIFCNLLVI